MEITEALRLYRAGDHETVRQLCDQIMRARDPEVRRDAAALRAMTLLHQPARADRLAGIAQLGQLAQENPSLMDRPECQLALGIARTGLSETAEALDLLETAAAGFAARRQVDRQAESLAALAEAWAHHGEWEITPPRFNVPRPQSPEEASRIRREQIGQIRERLAKLPGSVDALARTDLILARDFIESGDRVVDGRLVLEQIAASSPMTPAVADATETLAGLLAEEERWPEALAWYRRLAAEAPGESARQAEQRIREITRPQLMIDAPASAPTGRPVRVGLRVRNVSAVQVEVRRVELAPWLESNKGKLVEARLPTAGSLQLVREIDTQVAHEHDWWRSEVLDEALEFIAPAGAYVVTARAADGRERPQTVKRLVIVSDLTATMLIGPTEALIWAGPRAADAADTGRAEVDLGSVEARFWIFGSYVPTQPQFDGGVARFALPAESRVMLDKRWVCLMQADEHLALCRGELRPPEQAQASASVALVGAPPAPRAGRTLTVAGVVLSQQQRLASSSSWRLELRDVFDEVVSVHELEPSATGVFAADVPIAQELESRHLRVILRCDGQVVENVRGRFGAQVAPAGVRDAVVACDVSPQTEPGAETIPVRLQAWYPWGTRLGDTRVSGVARALGLPAPETGYKLTTALVLLVRGQLDGSGQLLLEVPLAPFDLPAGPRALGVWAGVTGWEGREFRGYGATLQATQPVHAWLWHEPTDPQVGQAVRFEAGWFDPTGRTGIAQARVEVQRDGETRAQVNLYADVEGLRSEPWQPEVAGTYEAIATLPRADGDPLRVARMVTVRAADPNDGSSTSQVRCAAHLATRQAQAGVQVCLEGRLAQPLLVVVEADDPLAAQPLTHLAGATEVFLPLEAAAVGARVVVLAGSPRGVEIPTRAQVAPDPSQAIEVRLDPPVAPTLPGTVTRVRVACTRAGGPASDAMLLARLAPAAESSQIHWVPGQTRSVTRSTPAAPALASSWAASDEPAQAEQVADGLASASPLLSEALFTGATLWTTARPAAAGTSELEVPLPETPGLYRLMVLARTPAGVLATGAVVLDTRGGLGVIADAPGRLTLGDRVLAGVMLANSRPEPVQARIRIDAGDGLHVESVRVGEETWAARAAEGNEALTLVVPADGRVWLRARVEAVRAGADTFKVEVRLPTGQQHAECGYQVFPAAQEEPAGEALRVKRLVLLLIEGYQEIDASPGKQRWQETSLRSGDRVLPGQHLLIRELVTLGWPLEALTWSQRVPPNCHVMLGESHAEQTVGKLQARRLDALRYTTEALPVGRQVHEYQIVAVRPGVCLLPPPEVRADGRSVSVEIEPAETLINVIDTGSAP